MAENEVKLKISADVSDLNRSLTQSAKALDDWSKRSMGGFSSMAESLGMLTLRFTAMAGPVIAAGSALYGMAQKTANAGDELNDMSKRTGVAVEMLSGLKYAAEKSGSSLDGVANGLKYLGKNMAETQAGTGEAKDAFKALGISVVDSNGKLKSSEDIFLQVADKFSRMEDGAGKTALALKIFGKSGTDLIPLLNEGSESIREMTAEAEKLGLTFTKEGAEAADQFNDNIAKLKGQITGFVHTLGNELIPMLNRVMETGLFGAPAVTSADRIRGLKQQIDNLNDALLNSYNERKKGGDTSLLDARIKALTAQKNALQKQIDELSGGATQKKEAAPVIADTTDTKTSKGATKEAATVFLAGREYAKETFDFLVAANQKLEEQAALVESKNEVEFAGRAYQQETLDFLSRVDEEYKKQIESAEKQAKAWYDGMQDFQASLSSVSSGSLSQIAGLFGEGGKMVGAIIEFISNIDELPGKLKESISALVNGFKHIGSAIGEIIREIVPELPAIFIEIVKAIIDAIPEIIDALIDALPEFIEQLILAAAIFIEQMVIEVPKVIVKLIQEIPHLIEALISGIWEGIKALFFGGELSSAMDEWAEEASTVTVELDITNAMNALQMAQDALLGALNETDRSVAREALLSAREAAILAEQTSSSDSASEDFSESFDGIFGMLGDWLGDLWDTITGAFSWAWEGLSSGLDWLWDGGLSEVFSEAWDGLSGVFGDAWDWFQDLFDFTWPSFSWPGIEWPEIKIKFHDGGLIEKAHTGKYITNNLAHDEVPIIAKVGEGVLNDYNGMKAIGGEAGLNYINKYGQLPKFHDGGTIGGGLPDFAWPSFSWPNWEELFNVSGLIDWIIEQLYSKYSTIIENIIPGLDIGEVLSDVVDASSGIVGSISNAISDAWEGIKSGFGFHTGGLIGPSLASYEVPIIAKVGEGVLNDYNGMKAIGGEAGLNFANKYGYLQNSGGGGQTVINNIQNISLEVVIDKEGNITKLTKSQGKQFLRSLKPAINDMIRTGELSFT